MQLSILPTLITPRSAIPNPNLCTLALLVSGQRSPQDISGERWAELLPLAMRQGLGPILLSVLLKNAIFPAGDRSLQPLVAAARGAALHFAMLEETRRRMSFAFAQVHIPAIWLKGIALAHTVYPEPRLRPMVDLDVLVPMDQRQVAGEIAQDLGFRPTADDFLRMVAAPESVRYHDVWRGGPGNKVLLEIHFRLLGLETERLLPAEQMAWFWQQTWMPDGLDLTILKPEAHLLYLCAHALLQHGEAYLRLLQLLDMHLLITQYKIDWDMVVERAHSFAWTYAVERSLELMVDRFDTRVPEAVFASLHTPRSGDQSLLTARKRQKKVTRWEEWKSVFRRQSTVKRARLIWTTLFPPKNFLRELYHLNPNQPTLPYYLYHLWDGSREVLRAFTSRWAG